MNHDENYVICPACNGSGEGSYDGSTCQACRGWGELPANSDDDEPMNYGGTD